MSVSQVPPVRRLFRGPLLGVLLAGTALHAAPTDTLVASELLQRPTDHSVMLHAVAGFPVEAYACWGPSQGLCQDSTPVVSFPADSATVLTLDRLEPDTRYWYRFRYRRQGDAAFVTRDEHTFRTRRNPGSRFTFHLTADDHLYDKKGIAEVMALTMRNQYEVPVEQLPDFFLDLGDTFGDDHNPTTITRAEIWANHLRMRKVFATLGHSSPFLFCLGNHEGESGYWLAQSPPDNMAVNGTLARKFWFRNPIPDGSYSGNGTPEGNGIGLPENYYAFTWGDALFVVLDAYRGYTVSAKPRSWDWTLGKEQYDWFRRTLETSTARHKFVFAHHVLGETRGGLIVARDAEWGGFAPGDTTKDQFDTYRPGWGKPIQTLMKDNGVEIFFQGHDHLFAREMVDGVVYQTCPMPSDSTYRIGVNDNGDAFRGDILEGSGFLRVSVAPESVAVEFVTTWLPRHEGAGRKNDSVVYRYAVASKAGPSAGAGSERRGPSVAGRVVYDPATSSLSFLAQQGGLHAVTLFDAQGRILLSRSVMASDGGNTLAIPPLPGGRPVWCRVGRPGGEGLHRVATSGRPAAWSR